MLNRRILSLGRRLRQIREEINEAFGRVEACVGCTRSRQRVSGRHGSRLLPPRERCCSSRTEIIFNDFEMFFLAAGGTHPRHLRRPSKPVGEGGCDFYGEDGCSLAPGDRPGVCIGYVCGELARELAARGDGKRINQMIRRMEDLQRIILDHAAER